MSTKQPPFQPKKLNKMAKIIALKAKQNSLKDQLLQEIKQAGDKPASSVALPIGVENVLISQWNHIRMLTERQAELETRVDTLERTIFKLLDLLHEHLEVVPD